VGLANLASESETCVGSHVHLVGVFISFEKNFYRLPFTPPLSLVRRIGPSNGFALDIFLLFISVDSVKSMLGVVLDLMCFSSSFSGIGSSFVTTGIASLENSAHFFFLELYSGFSASLIS
jgi:hypothetical protein